MIARAFPTFVVHCVLLSSLAFPQEDAKLPEDLTALEIEQLMNIDVTSVSKKEQSLLESPAAIYVITPEDIRRSGHLSIPETLRMVPGLQVARIDSNKWAISSRGFNGRYAKKLLVLMDGRSVYTPTFSGVYWDVQDTLLEDLDRVEVIRGPGASVWGANAVNGVINVISKSAKDTHGLLATAGGGTEDLGFGGIRYGGQAGEDLHYRVYGKYFTRDDFVDRQAHDTDDEWDMIRGGFRLDWDASSRDLITTQGDLYYGELGATTTVLTLTSPFSRTVEDTAEAFGGNLLGRWTRKLTEDSSLSVQIYYDRTERREVISEQDNDTLDLDFQHGFHLGAIQELQWGLGYRLVVDRIKIGSPDLGSLDPVRRSVDLFSAFLQDEVTLIDDVLKLIVGTKLEHNDYTGFELQPSGRLVLTPNNHSAVWFAASRAVSTPSRALNDSHLNTVEQSGVIVALNGDKGFRSEDLLAFELGYRVQPVSNFSLDLASFYNIYDDLTTFEPGAPFFNPNPAPGHVELPLRADNKSQGETYGIEGGASWSPTSWWKLNAGFTFLKVHLHPDGNSADATANDGEGLSPKHQAHLRSYMNLPHNLELDTLAYYVDHLSTSDVPHYIRLDVRLGWAPLGDDRLRLSLAFQNILDDRHPEFGSELYTTSTEVERSVYAQISWRF